MITYKLNKAITLSNGNEIDTLNLDYDSLSMGDLKTANRIASMIAEGNIGDVNNRPVSPRLDSNVRIGIAWAAAIKGTQGLTMNDVLKLSLVDTLCLSEDCLSSYLFR